MLFRQQAVDATRTRLYGRVLIATPIRFQVVTAFLCSILTALGIFLATASFSRIETVRGAVIPSKGIVEVRSPDTGVLTEFALKEGDAVFAGQAIGRIIAAAPSYGEGTRTGAEIKRIEETITQIDARIKQSARVTALSIKALEAERENLSAQIANAQAMRALQIEMMDEARRNAERLAKLSELDLVNAEALSQKNMGLIEARLAAQRLISDIENLTMKRDALAPERERLKANARLDELRLLAERAQLMGELRIISGAQVFDLTAPISGVATAVLASEGDNLSSGRQVFSILPEDSRLQVELYAPSRAFGFVEPGQTVSLLFDAFPYQRFGAEVGQIVEVANSVISPGGGDLLVENAEPVYRVIVRLNSEFIDAGGEPQAIQAGMLLNANIVIEDRTVFAWLLEPLLSFARRL